MCVREYRYLLVEVGSWPLILEMRQQQQTRILNTAPL